MKKKLNWSGFLAIEQVLACHSALQDAVNEAAEIEIDLSGCTGLDLAFLQLLCAGQRSARCLDKALRLAGFDPAALTRAAAENGFLRTLPCGPDCGPLCLWLPANLNGSAEFERELPCPV